MYKIYRRNVDGLSYLVYETNHRIDACYALAHYQKFYGYSNVYMKEVRNV